MGREGRHVRCVIREGPLQGHKLKGLLLIRNFSWLLMICDTLTGFILALFIIHEGRVSVLLIIVLLMPRIVSTAQ